MKILVLGFGQSLRGDDAIGLDAVRFWQATYPRTAAQVQVEYSESPDLSLLDLLFGLDAALIVDALRSPGLPGTQVLLAPDDLSSFTASLASSSHGWGLSETLKLGLTLDPSLASLKLTLIGIIGCDFTLGSALSAPVQASLASTAAMIEQIVRNLI